MCHRLPVMLMLFDYDGVIVDSFDSLLDLCARAQASLGCGRPPTGDDLRTLENLTFADLGRRIGLAEGLVPAYAERILELQKLHWTVKLFPAMAEVLSALAQKHTVAVITASQGEAVAASLGELGVGGAISAVLGGEMGSSKSERIAVCRARHGMAPADTFMIGDAISDIREGKRAGVKTVAVAWGYQDPGLLSREQPDFLIRSPVELLGIASSGAPARPPLPKGQT